MPLVRVEVRNEYALGAPEIYREANKEDPKEVLEGVAVAGLVGVLRQLGDLAEFAAEVFHGLQEEVAITSSRSNKLMGRVRRIEAALSPLEKAVLAQRSHLHFAYTAGSNWHARIRCAQNHFVYSDVPQFIMDSYEDCRGVPRLDLLDKFDPGGPGSCLKRYSDPTFFKRTSVASGDAGAEKIPKDKKSRKIKKRRSWPRNGKTSQPASFSFDSGRVQFTQMNTGGRASPARTASTYDSTLRSDFGEQSDLYLRNGSDCIEGDFRPSYSVQSEEQASRESLSSSVKRHDSGYLDYNFLQENVTDAPEISQFQEQVGCNSSSATCDETTEKIEPKTQEADKDGSAQKDDYYGHLGSSSAHIDLVDLGDNAVDFEFVEEKDAQPFNQAMPTLESGDVHLDEIESETDNFMDALNTIESEVETDTDCKKKPEVENCLKLENNEFSNGVCELPDHNLECQSSSLESNVLTSRAPVDDSYKHNLISDSPKSPHAIADSADKPAADILFNSVSVVDDALPSCQSSSLECNVLTNSSPVDDSYNHNLIPDSPKSPHAISDSANEPAANNSFNSVSAVDNALPSSVSAGDNLAADNIKTSNSYENGNIETHNGLEPVSCIVSAKCRDVASEMPISDGTRNIPESNKLAPETANVTSVTFWTNGGLLGLQPSKPPDFGAGKPDQTENCKNAEMGFDMDSAACDENQEGAASFRKPSWKISPADLDINLGNFGGSLNQNSRISQLSNKLLSTGSSKKLLPGVVENADASEKKNHQTVAHRTFSGRSRDIFGGSSPIPSPSSSPPLEHMKISFQPIDGFETSKLKLKFPDGNVKTECSSDIFPSFQLVPEVSVTRRNGGSDSDSDTFYRSSPDCYSNMSESNSEQWESSESPTSKDRDLYDALRRISLTESVSTATENGLQFPFVQNGMKDSESSCSFDLHNLETVSNSFRKEVKDDTNQKVPPTPPVQWRGPRPHPDGIFDNTLSTSTISQPKPAPFNEDRIFDTSNMQKIKRSSSLKMNGKREANQGKNNNEKDDFLHQIRTKSFNLRPTVTTKPSVPSGASLTVPVTAVLEKANAIRQAVGSDGEDNWSDT